MGVVGATRLSHRPWNRVILLKIPLSHGLLGTRTPTHQSDRTHLFSHSHISTTHSPTLSFFNHKSFFWAHRLVYNKGLHSLSISYLQLHHLKIHLRSICFKWIEGWQRLLYYKIYNCHGNLAYSMHAWSCTCTRASRYGTMMDLHFRSLRT